MAKRKTDEKDEWIKNMASALAWALPFTLYSVPCGAKCPSCRAKRLLKGIKPRKWEKNG